MREICRFYGRPTAKTLSASGGFAPLTPTRGSAPGPHWGLCPWTPLGALSPDPRYRLALRARHGLKPPKLKILATSLVTFPPLPQPKLVLDQATPGGCKAELT